MTTVELTEDMIGYAEAIATNFRVKPDNADLIVSACFSSYQSKGFHWKSGILEDAYMAPSLETSSAHTTPCNTLPRYSVVSMVGYNVCVGH